MQQLSSNLVRKGAVWLPRVKPWPMGGKFLLLLEEFLTHNLRALNLIKEDRARLITSGADIATWLEWEEKTPIKAVQKSLFVELSKEEAELYDLLKEPLSLDEITLKTKRPVGQIAADLIQLELKGIVRSLAGKRFEQL